MPKYKKVKNNLTKRYYKKIVNIVQKLQTLN